MVTSLTQFALRAGVTSKLTGVTICATLVIAVRLQRQAGFLVLQPGGAVLSLKTLPFLAVLQVVLPVSLLSFIPTYFFAVRSRPGWRDSFQ